MVKYGILHVHSEFSLNDSTQTPKDIVKWAAENGCQNITLTDHGTLLGIDDFMDAGAEYGINTIPGVEMYLENRVHLIIVARNYKGFQAISKALRDANEHQYIRSINGTSFVYPIMTDNILEELRGNQDIIVTSACIQGPISVPLLENYQITLQIKKIRLKQDTIRTEYELYMNAKQNYNHVSEQAKKFGSKRSAVLKYTYDTYERLIGTKKQKLKEYTEQLNKEQGKVNQLQIKIDALVNEITVMEIKRADANETLAACDKKIKRLNAEKKRWKKVMDDNKSKKNRYEKLESELTRISFYDSKKLMKKAKEQAQRFQEMFPNFYLELQNHGLEQEKEVMPKLVEISRETGIPLIAANDAHMTSNSIDCIRARQLVRFNYFNKHQDVSEADKELYLKTDEELYAALLKVVDVEAVAEAMDNLKILTECKVVFPKEEHYPKCESEKSFTEYLAEAREEKIQKGEWDEEHEERLKYEVKIIQMMGYVDYHMVVRDFCIAGRKLGVVPKWALEDMPEDYEESLKWIKSRGYNVGVGVGPGRGSAVGSLVCFLLGITNIDPIKYHLFFERFLNPERVSMPDIDTDIKTSLRQYLIRYIKNKYGEWAVCSIGTTSTYAPKASIQMAGRDRSDELYGDLPKKEATVAKKEYNQLTKKLSGMLPENGAGKLDNWDETFQKEFGNNEEACIVWERAKLIEGHVSHTGVHAGGIVISDNDNVNEYVPLEWREDKQVWATQCDMLRVEQKGMLKMDVLGLLTLDCISDCVILIKKNHGISVNLDTLPFESEVFSEIYTKGRTNSVFQVESSGMKQMLKEFGPTCFEDIILLIALYRPGPMQFIPATVEVKHGFKKAEYLTPMLEDILKETYGAIAYQEQIMQIFQILAGYSLGQADMVRRAMSKKKEEKLKIERKAFIYGDSERNITGCVANNIPEETADKLFDIIMDFAKYAFNKSHSTAYAMVSYQTAWLKYHYPLEFLCAMFNNKDQDKFEPLIEDCITYDIEILPPDINFSNFEFSTEGNKIRYGFSGIKGIASSENIRKIIAERKKGHFLSFVDFVSRCIHEQEKKCTLFDKGFMEALIKSGCFDSISPNRIETFRIYEAAEFSQQKSCIVAYFKNKNTNIPYVQALKLLKREWEIQFLGQLVSENPLSEYKEDAYYGCIPFTDLPNGNVTVFGFITNYESKISSAGNKMLIVNLLGKSGKATVLFMKEKSDYYENIIDGMNVVRITGTCTDGTIFGNSLEPLEANKNSYYFIADTEKAYNRLLIEVNQPEGLEELNIFTFYAGHGTADSPVYELKQPIMLRKKVTKATIKRLGCMKEK